MHNPFDLSGRRAVVTGVSNGIGAAIAIALRSGRGRGWAVPVGHGRCKSYRQEYRGARPAGSARQGGLRGHATVEALAERAEDELGPLDIWVNNAARLMVKPFLQTTDDDWHGLLAANLHGYFYGCRAAGRRMAPEERGASSTFTSAADILVISAWWRTSRPRAGSWA